MTTTQRQNIFPAFRYTDAWRAIAFLEQAFGFTRQAVFEGPGNTVGHAELCLGTASVGLNSATPPVADNPWTSVRYGIYVVLPDAAAVDQHAARALAGGARIAQAVRDTDYGSHDYSVWDLEGHLWGFGTYTYAAPGASSLSVGLRYRDSRAAVAWLAEVFGFERGLEVPGPGDGLQHAELRLGDSVLMAGGPGDDGWWAGERQATCVYVTDPDAHHRRAVEAGATIVAPVADTPYGARGYTARDPEGLLWTFSTYRPA